MTPHFLLASGVNGIWRYPLLRSSAEYHWHPAICSSNISVLGSGKGSVMVISFSGLRSVHGRWVLSLFLTITVECTQGVSDLMSTPHSTISSSWRWSSSCSLYGIRRNLTGLGTFVVVLMSIGSTFAVPKSYLCRAKFFGYKSSVFFRSFSSLGEHAQLW